MSVSRHKSTYERRKEAGVLGKLGPNGRKLCVCGTELPKYRKTWCSDKCYAEHNWNILRSLVYQRDRGVCANCGTDTDALRREYETIPRRSTCETDRREFRSKHGIPHGRSTGDWWDADHIAPWSEGGPNTLENLRTLCIPCHQAETRELARRKKQARINSRKLPLLESCSDMLGT